MSNYINYEQEVKIFTYSRDEILKVDGRKDCTLKTRDGKSQTAHKTLLQAFSPYLKIVLKASLAVVLDNVSFEELKSILDFIYDGEVSMPINRLRAFLDAAETLQIKGLTREGGDEYSGYCAFSNNCIIFNRSPSRITTGDCTLVVGHQFVKAHKIILTSFSRHFKHLLKSTKSDVFPIVVLRNVSNFEDLKSIMDFIYEGTAIVPMERLTSFLQCAENLAIKGLQLINGGEKANESCETSLESKYASSQSKNNVSSLRTFSFSGTNEDSSKSTKRYICSEVHISWNFNQGNMKIFQKKGEKICINEKARDGFNLHINASIRKSKGVIHIKFQ